MRNVVVLPGQNLFDIVLQEKGSLHGLDDVLKANGLRAGSEIKAGDIISITGEPADREAYRYIKKNNIIPATNLDKHVSDDVVPSLGGIGYWLIEQDFTIQ